jgi:hypothetical protein
VRWAYHPNGSDTLRIDWVDHEEQSREMDGERCRAWLEWLDQAITYELDGKTDIVYGPGLSRYSVHLPATCCLPSSN